jgi:hypothetical protein
MFKHSKPLFLAILLVVAAAAAAVADDPCPCPVTGYTWIADSCDTWNCAASAMVLANGDRHVLVLPTSSGRFGWVVLRRVVGGSVAVSPDAPFIAESFPNMTAGMARFSTFDDGDKPLLVTSMDGTVVVVHLREKEPRPHAVTH